MAGYITDQIKNEIKAMLGELVDDAAEGMDDLFGDQAEDNKKKVTLILRVNMAAKSATAIEIKTHSDYVLEPSIPAKHEKNKKIKVVDTAQGVIVFPEEKNDDGIDEE